MQKFLKLHLWLCDKFKFINALISFLVGAFRYMVCRDFSCAISYALTTAIIISLSFTLYKFICAKYILKKFVVPVPEQDVNVDKINVDAEEIQAQELPQEGVKEAKNDK